MSSPNVGFIHPSLQRILSQYKLIRDVLSGEETIKNAGAKYLPMPNACDRSPENMERYKAYLARAVFYGVTRRTLSGLVGQLFLTDPVIEIPNQLDALQQNANGMGSSLAQQAKQAANYTLAFSRAGVLTDYPATGANGVTVAELRQGRIRPTIKVYSPESIINWRTITIGGEEVLSLIVLREGWPFDDDGFEIKYARQYRVLRLDENLQYEVELWRERNPTADKENSVANEFMVHERFQPRNSTGQRLNYIPFSFIGSINNDVNPDLPEMYDLASLNVAHYRNSADYEESVFLTGQPTPVFSGLTQEWVEDVLKGTIALGSRGGIPLPEGGSASLLQASANSMAKEAMDTKERQMVALGAKLVEQREVQRTATEATIENAGQSSTLANVGQNVSRAFTQALSWAADFAGVAQEGIRFELNTKFNEAFLSSEERNQVIDEWQKGAITFGEMRASLRKTGVAFLDEDEALDKISEENAKQMSFAPTVDFTDDGL